MSAQVTITQLPAAGAIVGTEAVPIVQNGVTVQTTVAAITSSPNQTQTFLTLNQEATLANSRRLSGGTGVGLTDGGAQAALQITLNGASGSLETVGNGIVVKNGGSTVTHRAIAVSGSGLSVSNADGVSGDPTLQLTGIAAAVAALSGTGMLALTSGSVVGRNITGTTNQLTVTNGDGYVGNPTFAIADNAHLPGTDGVVVPNGTTAQQPLGVGGQIRFNTDTQTFDGNASGSWFQFSLAGGVTSFSGGGTGLTPATPTTGGVVLAGVLNPANGGTGVNSLTGYVKGSGTSPFTASATIPTTDLSGTVTNAQLANNSVTFNGQTVALGASGTITATATNALTIGTGLTGTSYNGSSAVTVAIDSTVTTLAGAQTLTNKTISGSANTLSNIANASLTNSLVTIGTTPISLGASGLTLGGLTSVAVTQDPVSSLQLATKQYVDAVAQGLNIQASCSAATPATLASITGGSVTYNNGASGVGATLTLSNALATLDGYTLLNGNRVVVKNEAAQANNGIYTWATGGTVLTRAQDFDTNVKIASGDFTFVTYGTLYANTSWVQTNQVNVVGTDAIVWAQFAGAGTYTAGTGLTLTGTQFSVTNTAVTAASYGSATQVGTFTVNAQGQLTAAANTTVTPAIGSVTGLGASVAAFLATPSSANLAAALTDETGTGANVFATSPTLTTPIVSGALTYGGVTLTALVSGTGRMVLGSSPTISNPNLGTPSLLVGTNITGLPLTTGVTGTLPIASGGTNSAATATAGGVAYGSGTAYNFTAAGTAGQVLTSTGSGAPVFAGISGGTF